MSYYYYYYYLLIQHMDYLHKSITKASIKRIASQSEWLLKYKLKPCILSILMRRMRDNIQV
jgi:hypothetical protein